MNPVTILLSSQFESLHTAAIANIINDYKIPISSTILHNTFSRLRLFFHDSNFNLHQFKDLLSAILECHKKLFTAMILAVNSGCDITKVYCSWAYSYRYPSFVIYHRYCALSPDQCACTILHGFYAYNINKIIFSNQLHEQKIKNHINNDQLVKNDKSN